MRFLRALSRKGATLSPAHCLCPRVQPQPVQSRRRQVHRPSQAWEDIQLEARQQRPPSSTRMQRRSSLLSRRTWSTGPGRCCAKSRGRRWTHSEHATSGKRHSSRPTWTTAQGFSPSSTLVSDESAFPHPPLKREGVVFSTIKACEETRAFLLHLVDKPFIEPPSTPATPILTGDPLNNRDAPANKLSESSDGLARFYARFVTFESLKHALDFMRRYASDHYTNLAWASTIISGLLSLKAKELGHASDVALSYSGYTIANSISGRLVDDLAIEQLSLPLVDRSQPTWPEVEDDSRLSSQPFLVSTPSVPQRTRARKTSTNPPCLNAVRLTLSSRFSTPSGVTLSTCSHSGSRKSIRQRQAIQLMSVPKVDVRLLLPSSRQRRAFCGEAYSPQRRMLPPTSLSSAKALLAPRLSVARLSLVLVQVGAVTPATLSHVTCCKSRSTRYSCCKTYRPRGSKLPRNGRLARRWTCSLYLQSQETVNQALYSNQRVEVTWREEEGKEEVEQTSTSPDAGVE